MLTQKAGQEGGGGRLRIGLFGGTFDPPHLGHLVVADQVRAALALDEVWFVVANDPWQKEGSRVITEASRRFQLVEAAIGDELGFQVSAVELEEGGPSYTIDTLTTLHRRHPDHEWFVIVGQDTAAGLDTWERAAELREMAEVVVVNRPDSSAEMPAGWSIRRVDVPALAISSTDLRARFAQRRPVRFLLPDPVIDLVEQWGIYRPDS